MSEETISFDVLGDSSMTNSSVVLQSEALTITSLNTADFPVTGEAIDTTFTESLQSFVFNYEEITYPFLVEVIPPCTKLASNFSYKLVNQSEYWITLTPDLASLNQTLELRVFDTDFRGYNMIKYRDAI